MRAAVRSLELQRRTEAIVNIMCSSPTELEMMDEGECGEEQRRGYSVYRQVPDLVQWVSIMERMVGRMNTREKSSNSWGQGFISWKASTFVIGRGALQSFVPRVDAIGSRRRRPIIYLDSLRNADVSRKGSRRIKKVYAGGLDSVEG